MPWCWAATTPLAVGSVSGVANSTAAASSNRGSVDRCSLRHEYSRHIALRNVHGMPLAALLGLGPEPLSNIFGYTPKIAPENTVMVGIRDIDAPSAPTYAARSQSRLYHARHRRAGHEGGNGRGLRAAAAAPPDTMSRWIWTGSTPKTRPEWARRTGWRHIREHTWPWRFWPTTVTCSVRNSRGQPGHRRTQTAPPTGSGAGLLCFWKEDTVKNAAIPIPNITA